MSAGKQITSTKNQVVRQFQDAGAGGEPDLLLAEGVRLVAEGLEAGLVAAAGAVSPRLRDDALRARLLAAAREGYECSDAVLARMSSLDTHQGVAAVFERPRWSEEDLLGRDFKPLVLVAAGVRDPGNLGALLRTAEAAGASGAITLQGGADPFRDKAVRGSMGSVFRLPTVSNLTAGDVVGFARRQHLVIAVADGGGDLSYLDADLRRPTMLVVGAEAAGLPAELLQAADLRMRIQIAKTVESLNVAVAAGVLLYEARRQRR